MVLRTKLADIMVDIADRKLSFDLAGTHRFIQQKNRRTGGILGKCLVDSDSYLRTGSNSALNQMLGEYFINKRLSQSSSP
jgi:hypothetical protein